MPKDTLNSEDEELTPIKGRYRNEVQNTKVQTQKAIKVKRESCLPGPHCPPFAPHQSGLPH